MLPMRWSRISIFVLQACALIGLLLVSAALKAQPPATTRPENLARTLPPEQDKRLPEFACDGVGLSDVFDRLRDVSGANIYVDWIPLESLGIATFKPITLKERNASLSEVLDKVLSRAGGPGVELSWGLEDGVIVISNPKEVDRLMRMGARRTERQRGAKAGDPLKKEIADAKFHGVGFSDALDTLAKSGNVKIDVDWKMLNTAGLDRNAPVTLSLRRTTLEHVLDLVLFQAGRYVVGGHPVGLQDELDHDGHIAITIAASDGNAKPDN